MAKYYSIEMKLYAECSEKNIATILQRGSDMGFTYYDRIGEIRDRMTDILDARTTAQKIMEAQISKPELGPCVYTVLDNSTDDNVRLCFYETENGFLELHMGSFGCPIKKGYFIDFAYYIRMCLDLCEDFPIHEVKTTMD